MNAVCNTLDRYNYNFIDVFKLIASFLVVIIHSNEVGAFIPDCIVSSFSNFAVPFFFIVSGFFFKKGLDNMTGPKEKKKYFIKYIRRLFIVYLFYSIISLPSAIIVYTNKYPGISIVRLLLVLFRRYLLCGNGVVWYILAMIEAAVILYFIDKHIEKYKTKVYSALYILIVVGLLLGINYDAFRDVFSNNFLTSINNMFYKIFSWSNNFIMKSIPYMGIGYLLYEKKNKINFSCITLCINFLLLSILNIVCFFLKTNSNIVFIQNISFSYFINIPQAILFFLIAINSPIPIKRNTSIIFRELSSSIYYLHTYFIYYLVDPIFGVESNFLIKFFIGITGSAIIYVIVKEVKFKPLMYVLNIKSVNN